MEERLKSLFDEIVATLREDASRSGIEVDPLHYVEVESGRWRAARETEEGIWMSLLMQMLRFGFPNYEYSHDTLPAIEEHLSDMTVLAEMDEKGKRKLAEIEELGLNLQRVRSVCKNARTACALSEDFGSLRDLVDSFESDTDLAAGIQEMFSYMTPEASIEFARELGWRKPGSSPAVRRVLSRMRDLVDGSLDAEGIQRAISGLAAATGRDEEQVDYLLEVFAAGERSINLHPICAVKFACYRCRVSDEQCAERRYEFGSAKEIVRDQAD